MSEFELEPEKTRREILRRDLDKCPPKSIALFNRMYGDTETIQEYRLNGAYHQIQRTLNKGTRT